MKKKINMRQAKTIRTIEYRESIAKVYFNHGKSSAMNLDELDSWKNKLGVDNLMTLPL